MAALNPYEYGHIIPWYAQFLDINGQPLSGGYVEIYEAGTTTPYISFQNFDGTPNPFRIQLTTGARTVAIGKISKRYDVYVYNQFGNLEYSRLNVGAGDSEGVNLTFTSSDGSIIITRDGNTVDLVVKKDEEQFGTVGGDSVNENGKIIFDSVESGDITVNAGNIQVEALKLYHITVHLDFENSTAGSSYLYCKLVDSEGGEHKFSIDNSRTKQWVEVSWDIRPSRNWISLAIDGLDSITSVSKATVYIHRVNPVVGSNSGGGGSTYTSGDGINISPENVISVNFNDVQPKLVAGTGIDIDPSTNTISATGSFTQVQADWNETDSSDPAYIKNKPTIPYPITIDQTYNASSANAQSGTAVAGAIATVRQVPASTSGDADKVLTVDALGVPSWAVVPSQSTGLFEAVYGTTPYADIAQAVTDKKIVYCRISTSGTSRMAFLAFVTTGSSSVSNNFFEFQYYRSNSSGDDSVFIYQVNGNNSWTTTERSAGIKTQVQSDWNTTSSSSASYIKNKPTIPAPQVQSDWSQSNSSAIDYIKNKPTLFSGDYNDLTNKPDLSIYAESSDLATVAFSGSYTDLINTPSIPAAPVQSNWNETNSNSLAYIQNKPTIPAAQVNADWNASSGVAEILNKPTIPVVGTITL